MSWSSTVNFPRLAGTCNYGACIYYNTSDFYIVAMLMDKATTAFLVHYSVYYTVRKSTNCVSCCGTDYLSLKVYRKVKAYICNTHHSWLTFS